MTHREVFIKVFTPRSAVYKMAKRSREDFEPSSPESELSGESSITARSVIHPGATDIPSSTSKLLHLDSPSGEAQPIAVMRCSLPPHRQTLTFSTYEDYDVHYAKTHTNRCVECRKNFPTEHFLNLHIEENHDALVSVRRERGDKTVSPRHYSQTASADYLSCSTHALWRIVRESALPLRRDACT